MLELIRKRRSIRTFDRREVSDDLVDQVLEAGRWAPSGMNNQPWRFAVIRDKDLKQEISSLTSYGRIINSADVLICVFFDQKAGYHRTKDTLSVGACIQNMLLAVESLGLGAVWLGEILKSEKELKGLISAPDTHELMAVIAMGHPEGPHPEPTDRRPLRELVFFRK
jgi:nitroreductase